MIYRSCLVIFCISIFISCDSNRELQLNATYDLEIDVDNPIEMNYSQVFDTCLIVPLQTTENGYIGNIDVLIYGKENIVILDRSKAKSIYIYDLHGKLKKVINRVGRGPGEYKNPFNVRLSEDESQIFLFDTGNFKVIKYTIKGDFLEEIKVKPSKGFTDFLPYSGKFYISLNFPKQWSEKLYLTDSKFSFQKSIYGYIPGDPKVINGIKDEYFFQKCSNKGFLYKEWLSNNILSFKHSSTHVDIFSVTFSEKNLELQSDVPINAQDAHNKLWDKGLYVLGEKIIDSKNLMFFNFSQGNVIRMGIWNKIKNETYNIKALNNDMDSIKGSITSIPHFNRNSNVLIDAIYPYQLKQIKEKRHFENNYSHTINRISVEGYDNPILIIYKIKK